jgi:hypothetical protein
MWPRSVCMKQVAVSPHIFSCCQKSNNEKYKVLVKKKNPSKEDFRFQESMYDVHSSSTGILYYIYFLFLK